jgi:hypothetical protein
MRGISQRSCPRVVPGRATFAFESGTQMPKVRMAAGWLAGLSATSRRPPAHGGEAVGGAASRSLHRGRQLRVRVRDQHRRAPVGFAEPFLYRLRGRRPSGLPAWHDKRAKKRVTVLPDDVTIHGIRRTVADGLLNRIGASPGS